MKKEIIYKYLKIPGYLLGYWILFVIIPFALSFFSAKFLRYHDVDFLDPAPFLLFAYVLFIAPFLFFIPYKIIKPKNKFLFIFLGVIVPYICIYIYFYFDIRSHLNFNFGF